MASARSPRHCSDIARQSYSHCQKNNIDGKRQLRNPIYDSSKNSYGVEVGEVVQVFSAAGEGWVRAKVTQLLEDRTGKYVRVEWTDTSSHLLASSGLEFARSVRCRKLLHVQSKHFVARVQNDGSISSSLESGSEEEKDPQLDWLVECCLGGTAVAADVTAQIVIEDVARR